MSVQEEEVTIVLAQRITHTERITNANKKQEKEVTDKVSTQSLS